MVEEEEGGKEAGLGKEAIEMDGGQACLKVCLSDILGLRRFLVILRLNSSRGEDDII